MYKWFTSLIYSTLMARHGFSGGYKDEGVVIIGGKPFIRHPAIITDNEGRIISREFFERLPPAPSTSRSNKEMRG